MYGQPVVRTIAHDHQVDVGRFRGVAPRVAPRENDRKGAGVHEVGDEMLRQLLAVNHGW